MLEDFKYIVDNSEYVSIDYEKLEEFVNNMGEVKYTHWASETNLELTEKEWIIMAIVIESMNFCFWRKPKWKIEYKGDIVSGSNALFYSIIREVEKSKDFLKIENLDKIDLDALKEIFKGEGECPFIEKRYKNLRESVDYIKNHDLFKELFSIKSDTELLNYITSNFKSFDDKSTYKGRVIHFNKRATLLTNDLYCLSETIKNNIHDVKHLSGCADYGVPRTFRDYGILVYNEELANLVDNEKEILHDSNMEIEIRGNMLYVIELIKEKLNKKNIVVSSVELDNIIWWMGKRLDKRSNSHHAVTIYY